MRSVTNSTFKTNVHFITNKSFKRREYIKKWWLLLPFLNFIKLPIITDFSFNDSLNFHTDLGVFSKVLKCEK